MGELKTRHLFHLHLITLILVTLSSTLVGSIEISPRLYHSSNAINHYNAPDNDEPYVVSIQQEPSLSVGMNSTGILTINLNRAYPIRIVILVDSLSDGALIWFRRANQTTKEKTGLVVFNKDTFGDANLEFETANQAGHAQIVATVANAPIPGYLPPIDVSSAHLSINIHRVRSLDIWIDIVGWIYFFAWSASFYFQTILNYKRQSVEGLNFDFLALNLLGFTFYFIYNYSLMFSQTVQNNYFQRNKYSRIPVEYNDLFFATHALVLSIFTFGQYYYYQGYRQTVSGAAKVFNYCTKAFIVLAVFVALVLYGMQLFNFILLLDVVMYLSTVKLIISLLKYSPQAYSNYVRKATSGWSIHNILLDLTGGTFSLLQMILISYNYNDWQSFFGNFTKFGLSVVSIGFDMVFIVQHYILYRYEEDIQNLDAVINESVLAPSNEQLGDE